MNAYRGLACLGLVSCGWASTAVAQSLAMPSREAQDPTVLGARAYACVDPADALARRRIQDEPCKWPLYHLPATPAPGVGELPRVPDLAQPAGARGDHAMFWRFPVQPMGPHEAPRHTFR